MQTQAPRSRHPFKLALTIAAAFGAAAVVDIARSVANFPLGELLIAPLANRIERVSPAAFERAAGIIALSGNRGSRFVEAGHLARRYPHLKIVITQVDDLDGVRALMGPGIDDSRLLVDTMALNTRENAAYARALIADRLDETWILVTSASHMPRAYGSFRKQGINVLPWPIPDQPNEWHTLTDLARHEYIGLVWYRALGATGSLFPAAEAPSGQGLAQSSGSGQD